MDGRKTQKSGFVQNKAQEPEQRPILVWILILCFVLLLVGSLLLIWSLRQTEGPETTTRTRGQDVETVAPGSTFLTTVETEGAGSILVQVMLPESPRYDNGAPVVVSVPTFFTPKRTGFSTPEGLVEQGIISVTLMYPGRSDGQGQVSEGEDDYGGADSLRALRDVILFALDKKENSDGAKLSELSEVAVRSDVVGLYAFSHPGIAAVNVLATYSEELARVSFFVGRENPTIDVLSAVEVGHLDNGVSVPHPAYDFPEDYSSASLALPYETVLYDKELALPYFDLNRNRQLDVNGDHLLGKQAPTMFDKRFYSRALLHALEDNGALDAVSWPEDVATPSEADAIWLSRETIDSYPKLSQLPNLHTMLVFADRDHVQPAADKPHIHQAYDGLREADIWTRLNPDASYVEFLSQETATGYVEHNANTEPSDWSTIETWAHTSSKLGTTLVPLAGVLEMADRAAFDNWASDLEEVEMVSGSGRQEHDDVSWQAGSQGGTYFVENPSSGSRLFVEVLAPENGTALSQSVILVPGGVGDSGDFLGNIKKDPRPLVEAGYTVVLFDPEGRGKSDGQEDNNGFVGQDGLVAIIRFASELTGGKEVGMVSFSYGISLAAGAIARYPDLPVAFLVDWEGPADRNDTGECDEDKTGHLGEAGCDNEAFWREREAISFIKDVEVPYWRLQTERDHAQPDVLSAVRMVNAAVAGSSPWVRLNDREDGATYDESTPPVMYPEAIDRQIMQILADETARLLNIF